MPAQVEHLASMANQIALNFGERRDMPLASQRAAAHIEKFWTRAMRDQLFKYWQGGGEGLSPAVELLLQQGVCNPV